MLGCYINLFVFNLATKRQDRGHLLVLRQLSQMEGTQLCLHSCPCCGEACAGRYKAKWCLPGRPAEIWLVITSELQNTFVWLPKLFRCQLFLFSFWLFCVKLHLERSDLWHEKLVLLIKIAAICCLSFCSDAAVLINISGRRMCLPQLLPWYLKYLPGL